jgi:guanine deaminase
MDRVFIGRVVNFLDENTLEDFAPGFLAVDRSGEILEYGNWNRAAGRRWHAARKIACRRSLIMPGLVDTHLHLPQMHLRGIYGADLLQWLRDYILPAEAQFADTRFARRMAREFFSELLKNGTTTALVYSSVHRAATDIAFQEAARAGIRAIIGKVMMDQNVPAELREPTRQSLRDSLALSERWHGYDRGRLQYAFAPRFAPSCSEQLMRSVGAIARRSNAYVTSHLAETLPELELTRRLFPGYASYTDLYYRMGLLGPRTIMAHCIHLGTAEFHLLARTQTKVAHCPSANLFLHSGNMDVRRIEQERIGFGLGTDVGAGPSFSLFNLLQNMYFLRKVTPAKAFYHATLGGARALSLDREIGSFHPGKQADFILVDYSRLTWMPDRQGRSSAFLRINELLAQLMFRGDDRLIQASYVRGRCVYGTA